MKIIAIVCLCLSLFSVGNLIISTNDPFESLVPGIMFFVLFLIFFGNHRRKKKRLIMDSTAYINPYTDMTPFQEERGWPIVTYPLLNLESDEVIIYAVPAQTFIEKEQVVGYKGGSSGYSVRIAKGLTLRQGSNRGHAVRQDVRKCFNGDYIITNKRLLFLGDQKSFELKCNKITASKPIANDAITIVSGGKNYNLLINQSCIKDALGFTITALRNLSKEDLTQFILVK